MSSKNIIFFLSIFSVLFLYSCSNTRIIVEGTKRIIAKENKKKDLMEKNIEIGKDKEFSKGHYKIGNPYIVNEIEYIPKLVSNYDEIGIASWYGPKFHNKLTANGEVFDQNLISAAHKTLPLPSIVKVTNLNTKKYLYIRINDRGPFVNDRIIDLSKEAAIELNIFSKGTEKVRVQFLETGPHLLSDKFMDHKYLSDYAKKINPIKKIANNKRVYYYLQFGAFSERTNAVNFLEKIKVKLDKKSDTYSSIFIDDNINYLYKILLGPYEKKITAKIIADELSEIGLETIIITDRG